MNQPSCAVVLEEGDPCVVTPSVDQGVPAAVLIWGVLAMIGVFELWAWWTHNLTISQRIQRAARGHGWLRWVGVGALAALAWHWFLE